MKTKKLKPGDICVYTGKDEWHYGELFMVVIDGDHWCGCRYDEKAQGYIVFDTEDLEKTDKGELI